MIYQSTVMLEPIMIGIILGLIIFLIISIGLAVWVNKDAKKRDMNATLNKISELLEVEGVYYLK